MANNIEKKLIDAGWEEKTAGNTPEYAVRGRLTRRIDLDPPVGERELSFAELCYSQAVVAW